MDTAPIPLKTGTSPQGNPLGAGGEMTLKSEIAYKRGMQTKFQLNSSKYVALVPLPPNTGSSFQESPPPGGRGRKGEGDFKNQK